jgi:hypothetical protein
MDNLVNLIPSLIGISADQFYTYLIVLVTVANLVGRAIPDSATGVLGATRKVAKTVGLYIGNRISPAVNANDVARAVVATVPDSVIKSTAGDLSDAVRIGVPIGESAGELANSIIDAAEGNSPGRPYEAGVSPEQGSTVPDEFRTDGPFQRQRDGAGRFVAKDA